MHELEMSVLRPSEELRVLALATPVSAERPNKERLTG